MKCYIPWRVLLFVTWVSVFTYGQQVLNYTIEESSTARLSCGVDNTELHTTLWIDPRGFVVTFGELSISDDERVFPSQDGQGQSVLVIDSVKTSDQGVYTCQVNSDPVKQQDVSLNISESRRYLLVATDVGFYQLDADLENGPDLNLLTTPSRFRSVKYAAYDPQNMFIYWTQKNNKLRRIHQNGTEDSFLTDGGGKAFKANDFALDYASSSIYWTYKRSIGYKSYQDPDSPAFTIMKIRKKFKPDCIAVYPEKGIMIFTNIVSNPTIEKAWFDGSGHTVILESSLGLPYSLAIDTRNEKLYWADASTSQIEMADLDGGNRAVVHKTDDSKLGGLMIQDQFLYWMYRESNVVERISINSSADTTKKMFNLDKVSDLCPVNTYSVKDWKACERSNGPCSHICFVNKDMEPQCACPLGLVLWKDTKTCSADPPCKSDQFECVEGEERCIDSSMQCDGANDCEDGSDEDFAICPSANNTTTSPAGSTSSEINCAYNEFTCSDGSCISIGGVCDGEDDCQDGSDENACLLTRYSNTSEPVIVTVDETSITRNDTDMVYNETTIANTNKTSIETVNDTSIEIVNETNIASNDTGMVYNETSVELANETSVELANETSIASNDTGMVYNDTSIEIANETSIASNDTGMVYNETSIEIANETSIASNDTRMVYNETTIEIANETSIASNDTGMVYNETSIEIVNETSIEIVNETSIASNDTGMVYNETSIEIIDVNITSSLNFTDEEVMTSTMSIDDVIITTEPIPYACKACSLPITTEDMVREFCEADVVMKMTLRKLLVADGNLVLSLRKRKRFFKTSGLSVKDARLLTPLIEDGAKCTCDTLEVNKRQPTKYLLMGKRDGYNVIANYVIPLVFSNLEFRQGIKAIQIRGLCA